MLLTCISFVVVCSIISAAPQAERTKDLGTYAYGDLRLDFPCTDIAPSPTVPTSVHKLRPADIKYIGAIGDSLTAASGANALTLIGMLFNNRGVSWSMGGTGDLSDTVTLPNILRKYNSNIYGQSTGTGNQNSTAAKFNVAKPGAVSDEMPGQANMLVDRMIADLGQDEFASSWKIVTFFVGGNDLCAVCTDTPTPFTADNYIKNIKATLDILKARMPKTLVNFATVLNIAELEDLHEGLICQTMQNFVCDCAINVDTRPLVHAAALEFQKRTREFMDEDLYEDSDDFTVVLQPFMQDMTVPRTEDGYADFSFFAADCFHFSKKGHAAAAIELWNNMFEPVGKKRTLWNLEDKLICPSLPDGYIYTKKNSPQ
jgi:phospholipase B1